MITDILDFYFNKPIKSYYTKRKQVYIVFNELFWAHGKCISISCEQNIHC